MSIVLQKGGSLNLTKKETALKKIMIGLGWELNQQNQMDLDASLFVLGANGKLLNEQYFIFYNNLLSPDGAVQHTGDNRTGMGDGDDEMILVNLPLIDQRAQALCVVVTIHDAAARRHHLGLLREAYVRVVDVETKREILRYDLDADFGSYADVEIAKLHRQNNEWYFSAVGLGGYAGLQGYVDKYV